MNKAINVADKQVLRGLILQICGELKKEGANMRVIISALRSEGLEVAQDEISDACDYLEDKGLVNVKRFKSKTLAGMDIVRITVKGVDVLDGIESVLGVELSFED